jgi:hypothetical protein
MISNRTKIIILVIISVHLIIIGLLLSNMIFGSQSLLEFLQSPFNFLSQQKSGWILLLVLQSCYLSLDLASVIENDQTYGLIGAYFILAFGSVIFITGLYESTKKDHFHMPTIFEGMFYILLGLAFIEFRSRLINKELLKEESKKRVGSQQKKEGVDGTEETNKYGI